MVIQILGTGCPKCQAIEANAKTTVEKAGLDAQVVKVTDIEKIGEMGVITAENVTMNVMEVLVDG